MPYRKGKYIHPDQLPYCERLEWYERNPFPGSWGAVQQARREEWRKECEWMSDPEEVRKHNERVKKNKRKLAEEAKRRRQAEEGVDDE
jgi:hypothetical protein